MSATLARAAAKLPANKSVKWGLGSNLWNYFPRVPFTDILDVMHDTGFIGLRLTQFPQILQTYELASARRLNSDLLGSDDWLACVLPVGDGIGVAAKRRRR